MSESANTDSITLPAGEATVFKSMLPYAAKCLVVAIIFFGGISFLLPDLNKMVSRIQTEVRKDQNRIRLTGLFTTNPAVHMKVSYLREEAGDIKGAVLEIELAIGLLELHSQDKEARSRYQARLDELRRKVPKEDTAIKGK